MKNLKKENGIKKVKEKLNNQEPIAQDHLKT